MWVAYVGQVLGRFKKELGGGSILLVLAGVIEHFTRRSISWPIYIWLLTVCFVLTLIVHGAEQYQTLAQRLRIGNLSGRAWDDPSVAPGCEYYFEVSNESKGSSVEHVNVELIRMAPDPIGYLPAHLHLKHDNKPPRSTEFVFATEFSLHPGGSRQVDLITGPITGSAHPMIVTHVVVAARTTIPAGKYKLFVRATAKDTPQTEAVFEAWVDASGALQCVQL